MAKRVVILVWLSLAAAAAGVAQDELPASVLNRLKLSTVQVRVEESGGLGTGFVFERAGRTALVATNAHVLRARAPIREARVVLNPGTARERVVAAQVVDQDAREDLALLKIEGDDLPPAIEPAEASELRETLPVYILGFPFGDTLGRTGRAASVTIARGSISSIRRDKDDVVDLIQLDGELNPGNSGGPIVDRAGKLIGVAVAKLELTNIGLALPAYKLQSRIAGRVTGITLEPKTTKPGTARVQVTVRYTDPLGRIEKVAVLLMPRDKVKEMPALDKDKRFAALPGGHRRELEMKDGVATGTVELANRPERVKYAFQTVYQRKGERPTYCEPGEVDVSFQAEDAPASAPAPEDFGLPLEPLAARVERTLPAEIEQLEVAGNGRWLVMKLRDLSGLAVFDLGAAELKKVIRLRSADFVCGAGGRLAVVYYPDENTLETWDLESFERVKSKPNPFASRIAMLLMGAGSSALALAYTGSASETPQREVSGMSLLDTRTLQPVKSPAASMKSGGYRVCARAASTLEMFTEWHTSVSPSGVTLYVRRGSKYESAYQHDSAGALLVGDDGRVYTSNGTIYSSALDVIGRVPGYALFPGLGGSMVLGINAEGKTNLYPPGSTSPLCPWIDIPNWKTKESRAQGRGLVQRDDERIVFAPLLARVAIVPFDFSRIVVEPFDLKAALERAAVDYLVVVSTPPATYESDKPWRYAVQVLSRAGGVKYRLDFGPDGMQVSDAGVITWTPKKAPANEAEKVVLFVSDSSGEQTYHNFTLHRAGG
jgi:hypothetical protein